MPDFDYSKLPAPRFAVLDIVRISVDGNPELSDDLGTINVVRYYRDRGYRYGVSNDELGGILDDSMLAGTGERGAIDGFWNPPAQLGQHPWEYLDTFDAVVDVQRPERPEQAARFEPEPGEIDVRPAIPILSGSYSSPRGHRGWRSHTSRLSGAPKRHPLLPRSGYTGSAASRARWCRIPDAATIQVTWSFRPMRWSTGRSSLDDDSFGGQMGWSLRTALPIHQRTIRTGPIGYCVRRLIGFGVVLAGVSIMFLPVSTNQFGLHEACGWGWPAMFSSRNNTAYECGAATLPHLWIAGAVAAVGMGIALWGARRRWLVAMVGLAVLVTVSITIAGLVAAQGMGGV